MPYNYYLFGDTKEGLVDVCLQVLVVLLNHSPSPLIVRYAYHALCLVWC